MGKYAEFLKQKPEDLARKFKEMFAPRKDKAAMKSAIENTFLEMKGIEEEIETRYAENIGNFKDIMSEQMKSYEELRKKEFILKHLQEDYKNMWGKELNLATDADPDDE